MKLIPVFYIKGNEAYITKDAEKSFDPVETAILLGHLGADGIFAIDISNGDKEHEQTIECCKELVRSSECPLYLGGNVHRFEDVKKYLYTGAAAVFINPNSSEEMEAYPEAKKRFGEKQVQILDYEQQMADAKAISEGNFSGISNDGDYLFFRLPQKPQEFDVRSLKQKLSDEGFSTEQTVAAVSWDELKKDGNGLVPCIVQDYQTDEVLMMAYMDEAAYLETIRDGRMCYYSRSRKQRWLKGETSGHFQYVKSLYADCDKDTLLAKVAQIGSACHTGARSCFFNQVFEKETAKTANPNKVFENVYDVIMDRKLHPKEGSYTNYLFDKGIDKILKKCGEEATEIVIAAKNPDPEEIKYEISDFLYHVMVLMAEKGVTWEDITRELANR